ncbi:unnamed protein product [Mytilus coruscus]|uniref:EGF-like domain-containing protein n=1 Tax=Mytilus coruscus TaxID=42192 RepID=A0A6J8ELF9_MYTCO|nr:unnamed protein product [Mytilus coruscus]
MDFVEFICFYIGVSILSVSGSHFRGGTISWRYLGGNMVEFKYKLAWFLGSEDAATWTAIPSNGGSSVTVYSGQYVKTATNSLENWEQGEGTFTYNFTTTGPYRVSYTGSAWIGLSYGSSGSWNLETVVDLHKRSDTLKPNHSPQTTSRAIYRVQYGCPVSIKIPMIDVDGDHVRCRWATSLEADSISKLVPNAHLDQSKCTITFTANLANNYTNNGWFAAALTIEDFPATTITVNRNSYTASTPLTQIPLQFLIHTETIPGLCNDKPVFVSPTSSEGTVTTLKAFNSFTTEFYVHADSGVKSIDINGPLGISKTALSPDKHGRSNVWLVVVRWTPTQADQGTHIICASAEDNHKQVLLYVDPCDSSPCLNHATCIRGGYTSDYTCSCVQGYSGIQCQTSEQKHTIDLLIYGQT